MKSRKENPEKEAAIGKGSRRPHSRLLPSRTAAFAAAASSFVRDAGLRLQLQLEKKDTQ
jgi:hypothetical protein